MRGRKIACEDIWQFPAHKHCGTWYGEHVARAELHMSVLDACVCVCVVHWVMGNTERVTVCKVERMDFVGLSVWLVTWRRLHEV